MINSKVSVLTAAIVLLTSACSDQVTEISKPDTALSETGLSTETQGQVDALDNVLDVSEQQGSSEVFVNTNPVPESPDSIVASANGMEAPVVVSGDGAAAPAPVSAAKPVSTVVAATNEAQEAVAPEVVDPTAPFPIDNYSGYLSLSPAHDTFVRNNNAESVDDTPLLLVKGDPAGGFSRAGLLNFNLSNYANRIEEARLIMYTPSMGRNSLDVQAFGVSDSWAGTPTRWHTAPTSTKELSRQNTSANKWVDLDVTAFVKAESTNDGEASLRVQGVQTGTSDWMTFASSESENPDTRPRLMIKVRPPEPSLADDLRYLKVVVESEENGFKQVMASELEVLDSDGQPIDRSAWSVVSASDQSSPATNLFDGDTSTIWKAEGAAPHNIVIDMGKRNNVHGIVYWPTESGFVGRFKRWHVLGSRDMSSWSTIASGNVPHGNGNSPKVIYANTSDVKSRVFRREVVTNSNLSRDEYYRTRRGTSGTVNTFTGLYTDEIGSLLQIYIPSVPENHQAWVRLGISSRGKTVNLKQGMNYLQVQKNGTGLLGIGVTGKTKEAVTFQISGSAVSDVPTFYQGKTKQSDWKNMLESSQSFSAVLVSKYWILVPRRDLAIPHADEDIEKLLRAYDGLAQAEQYLMGMSPHAGIDQYNTIPRIFHTTINGYMWYGNHYLGFHEDLTYRMLKLDRAKYFWGIGHELGHSQQDNLFNFQYGSMGEDAANVYAVEHQYWAYHDDDRNYTRADEYGPRIEKFINYRKDLESKGKWVDFNSLPKYNHYGFILHTQYMFGERFMPTLYRMHRRETDKLVAEHPEMNRGGSQYLYYASRASGYDLRGYFTHWGIAINSVADKLVADLKLPALDSKRYEEIPTYVAKK